jgi:hypothetical protein
MAKTVVSAPFPAPDDDDREAVSKLPPDPSSHKEEKPMATSDDAVTKPVDPTTPKPAAVEVPPTPTGSAHASGAARAARPVRPFSLCGSAPTIPRASACGR